VSKPARIDNKVLLPEPEAPTNATLSPAETLRLAPSRMRNSPELSETTLLKPVARKMGAVPLGGGNTGESVVEDNVMQYLEMKKPANSKQALGTL
jgi:hypothetical protein